MLVSETEDPNWALSELKYNVAFFLYIVYYSLSTLYVPFIERLQQPECCQTLGIFQWHYDLTETSEYVGHNWPNYPHEQKFKNVYQILYTSIAYFCI